MANKKISIFDQLKEKVTPEIEDKLQELATLREQADQKAKNVGRVRQQKKDLEDNLIYFKGEAGKAMMNGEDPLPWLDKAQVAKEQIQALEDFLPSVHSDAGAEEKKQIKNLLDDLAREVKPIIHQSEVKAQAKADLDAALSKAKKVVDEWHAGVDEFYEYYGLPKGDLTDRAMSKKQLVDSGNNLHKWAQDYFS